MLKNKMCPKMFEETRDSSKPVPIKFVSLFELDLNDIRFSIILHFNQIFGETFDKTLGYNSRKSIGQTFTNI